MRVSLLSPDQGGLRDRVRVICELIRDIALRVDCVGQIKSPQVVVVITTVGFRRWGSLRGSRWILMATIPPCGGRGDGSSPCCSLRLSWRSTPQLSAPLRGTSGVPLGYPMGCPMGCPIFFLWGTPNRVVHADPISETRAPKSGRGRVARGQSNAVTWAA